jgi:transcription initiation factor TFIIIB Brf1 subunit/transcription initiation factor TFIIB
MKCKRCGGRLRVVRTVNLPGGVMRERVCEKCGTVLKTFEVNCQRRKDVN